MNRVVTIASSGLIAAGLAIMPITAFAQGGAAATGSTPTVSSTGTPSVAAPAVPAAKSVATAKPAADAKASTATAAAKPATGSAKDVGKDQGGKVVTGGNTGGVGAKVGG